MAKIENFDLFNYKGEEIGFIPVLRKTEYGTGEKDDFGRPLPDWRQIINGDKRGFDKTNSESNGKYKMKVVLPKHTRLVRYGPENGKYTAPEGTEYEKLSLPYTKESVFYHEYEVKAESITVIAIGDYSVIKKHIVVKGKVAPGFDYPGGGVQYYHPYTMLESIRRKLIERIK